MDGKEKKFLSQKFGQPGKEGPNKWARKSKQIRERLLLQKGEHSPDKNSPYEEWLESIEQLFRPRAVKSKGRDREQIDNIDRLRAGGRNKRLVGRLMGGDVWAVTKRIYIDREVKPKDLKKALDERERTAQELNREFDRDRETRVIQQALESSLHTWMNYLWASTLNPQFWFRYYTWRSITDLTNKVEDGAYTKRTKGTIAPYPPLNAAALSDMATTIQTFLGGEEYWKWQQRGNFTGANRLLQDEDFREMVSRADFGELYYHFVKEHVVIGFVMPESGKVTGKWMKFSLEKSEDPNIEAQVGVQALTDAVAYTGWCVEGEDFAQQYLEKGDFYVFFADQDGIDVDGKPNKVPCIGIATEHDVAVEIRGTENAQNLHTDLYSTLEQGMDELGVGDYSQFLQKIENMERLTALHERFSMERQKGIEDVKFTVDELRFLYGMDGDLNGFGYDEDPRANSMRAGGRSKPNEFLQIDISRIVGCEPSQVAVSWRQIDDKTVALYGPLLFEDMPKMAWDKTSLRYVFGSVNILQRHHSWDSHISGGWSFSGLDLGVLEYAESISINQAVALGAISQAPLLHVRDFLSVIDCPNLTSIAPEFRVGGGLRLVGLPKLDAANIPDDLFERVGGKIFAARLSGESMKKMRAFQKIDPSRVSIE